MNARTAIVVAVLTAASPVLLGAGAPRSVHEQALLDHADLPPFDADDVVPPTAEQKASRARDEGGPTVMGYLPFWVEPENIPWEFIDILAWFSVPTNADGSLGNDHGWGDEGADALIAAAHEVGAKVVLSTTRFGGDEVHELLSDPVASAAAIDNLVQAMLDGGGDGIDVDFEGLLYADRDALVSFVQELRAALDTAQPGSLLTMATPAVDWSGAWDYDVLAESADVLFIMGYVFHGTWSNPGPVAPLDPGPPWGNRCLRWAVQDYLEWGGEQNADRFVLGLPLYGYHWEAADSELGAAAVGDAWSVFWHSALPLADEHGSSWDEVSATPWSTWEESPGDFRQLWYEDAESIRLKALMTRDEGIGGFGFWALNYDEGDPDLWQAIGEVVDDWGDDDDDDDDDSAAHDDDDSAPLDDDDVTDDRLDPDDVRFGDDDGGIACACTGAGAASSPPGLLVLLPPLLLLRRRR